MKRPLELVLMALLTLPPWSAVGSTGARPDEGPIGWTSWSDEIFQRAAAEDRFLLLNLHALWCHWCHVMERETYRNRQVKRLIGEKYIAVRADQDAHPDLASRYGDWGWPATIVFAADGSEIVRRRGYIAPPVMVSMLQAIIEDPSPGPSVFPAPAVSPTSGGRLTAPQRERLRSDHFEFYDAEFGGWGNLHKFIDAQSMDYALAHAWGGDKREEQMARQTLQMALNLIDPEWGGAYQYSDRRDWRSPHYEKIMPIQASYLRHYARAYSLWGQQDHLAAATGIYGYLRDFLRAPGGGFYSSQDADLNDQIDGEQYFALRDQARRQRGMPQIDRNQYARDNGWAIVALTAYHDSLGDRQALQMAQRAANWVERHRALGNGGYGHGEVETSRPHLGDTLAMAEGHLALYRSSGERKWLRKAQQALAFIETTFRHPEAGYFTRPVAIGAQGVFAEPVRTVEQNVSLARTANLAFHYSGARPLRVTAEHAMRYLSSPAVTDGQRFAVGILLADEELASDPVHIAIVGAKDDKHAQALHAAALRYPVDYKRVDWWDRAEGKMPNADVRYPQLSQAAAFACAERSCSLPVFDSARLAAVVDRLSSRRGR